MGDIFQIAKLARPSTRIQLPCYVGWEARRADVNRYLLVSGFQFGAIAWLVAQCLECRNERLNGRNLGFYRPEACVLRPPPLVRDSGSPGRTIVSVCPLALDRVAA